MRKKEGDVPQQWSTALAGEKRYSKKKLMQHCHNKASHSIFMTCPSVHVINMHACEKNPFS